MQRSLWFFLVAVGVAASAPGQLATERAGTSQLMIAAAGAVTGLNGTFFRSDISVFNFRDTDQRVRFQWLPRGMSGIGLPLVDRVIPKNSGISSEDFVTEVLHQTDIGSILVTAYTPDGQFDTLGKLHATARIWSNQPGLSSGTVSQSFPVISLNEINSTDVIIVGQRRDTRYRTNVGIINPYPSEQTFRVSANADGRLEAFNVVVPPLSMQQTALTGLPATSLQIEVTNVTQGFQSTNWVAYGSSVDNDTGDSWSSLGFVVQ